MSCRSSMKSTSKITLIYFGHRMVIQVPRNCWLKYFSKCFKTQHRFKFLLNWSKNLFDSADLFKFCWLLFVYVKGRFWQLPVFRRKFIIQTLWRKIPGNKQRPCQPVPFAYLLFQSDIHEPGSQRTHGLVDESNWFEYWEHQKRNRIQQRKQSAYKPDNWRALQEKRFDTRRNEDHLSTLFQTPLEGPRR